MGRVFISGSSDGLGLMAARLLIDQGHEVALHGRNEGRSRDALAAAAGARGVVTGDLSTIAGARSVADEVNKLGRFDAVMGTRLYTANTGSSTVSVYDTTDSGEPREIQAAHTSGPGFLFQLALDPTERFLYVIGQRGSHAAPGNALHVFAVDEEDGTLSELPSSPAPITVQSPDARPQGVAVF